MLIYIDVYCTVSAWSSEHSHFFQYAKQVFLGHSDGSPMRPESGLLEHCSDPKVVRKSRRCLVSLPMALPNQIHLSTHANWQSWDLGVANVNPQPMPTGKQTTISTILIHSTKSKPLLAARRDNQVIGLYQKPIEKSHHWTHGKTSRLRAIWRSQRLWSLHSFVGRKFGSMLYTPRINFEGGLQRKKKSTWAHIEGS